MQRLACLRAEEDHRRDQEFIFHGVRMPSLSTSHKPKTQHSDPAELQEQIRYRAYEIYEQRNRTAGHELDDWLQAEAELTETKTQQRLDLDRWVAYDGWHCTEGQK